MPGTNAEARRAYRARHPERVREQAQRSSRAYYERHRSSILSRTRQRKYSLTADELGALLARADGGCEVCGARFNEESRPNKSHIDHCHKTGRVRGVLCARCNWALGNVDDNAELLLRLAAYLKEHNHAG